MESAISELKKPLGDRQVWDGLGSFRKDASGYGLKHLFVGAEGTLGLVTKAVLKLEPRRSERQSFFAAITDFDRLPQLYSLAQEHFQQSLAAFELIPNIGVELVCAKYPSVTRPMSPVTDWYILGQLAANESLAEQAGAFLAAAVEQGLISDGVVAQTNAQEENLWNLRDELPPDRIFDQVGAKFDVAVPTNQVPTYFNEIVALARKLDSDLTVYTFGHLGDGNLHLYGHRGAIKVAPENTMAGFIAAKDLGAEAIEFDVRLELVLVGGA